MTGKLRAFVETRDLGHVVGDCMWYRKGTTRTRAAELQFFFWERLPRGPVPKGRSLIEGVPDLIFNLITAYDRWIGDLNWAASVLEQGVRVATVIDVNRRSAICFKHEDFPVCFRVGDDFEVPDILPGFRVKLASLFE